jgi:hypothetical protein
MVFVCFWRNSPQWARASSFLRFLDQAQRRTTVGRTPLDERSARHKDLQLTTHNTHNRQTSMTPVRFEPTTPPGERPQAYALDRATGHWDRRRIWWAPNNASKCQMGFNWAFRELMINKLHVSVYILFSFRCDIYTCPYII